MLERGAEHTRSDVGKPERLEQALDRPVLAERPVQHGEDDVDVVAPPPRRGAGRRQPPRTWCRAARARPPAPRTTRRRRPDCPRRIVSHGTTSSPAGGERLDHGRAEASEIACSLDRPPTTTAIAGGSRRGGGVVGVVVAAPWSSPPSGQGDDGRLTFAPWMSWLPGPGSVTGRSRHGLIGDAERDRLRRHSSARREVRTFGVDSFSPVTSGTASPPGP